MKFKFPFWRAFKSAERKEPTRSRCVRLTVERLEDRNAPSAAPAGRVSGGPRPAPVPFADSAVWSAKANRAFVQVESSSVLQTMYFNTPASYQSFVQNFSGVLRTWVHQADAASITSDAGLQQFLDRRLNAKFALTHGLLAQAYPGQTAETYRLLMTMNLVTGFYRYASVAGGDRTLAQKLHLRSGDCTEIAELLQSLVQLQGIPAKELEQSYNFQTSVGHFIASHDVVYAGGLWLDAEVNTAFALNLTAIQRVPPAARLQSLLANNRVFGFYNWYLQPQVRAEQLARGLDGGILSFDYQYYFEGIGQGNTSLRFIQNP
jgi:hypothetical protein